jgi:hypothetical protein
VGNVEWIEYLTLKCGEFRIKELEDYSTVDEVVTLGVARLQDSRCIEG